MHLDEINATKSKYLGQTEITSPAVLDEIAYVLLSGKLGIVPQTRILGKFKVGSLELRYHWSNTGKDKNDIDLENDFLSLSVSDTHFDATYANTSIENLIGVWNYVQSHSDAMIYSPGQSRKNWLARASTEFGWPEDFILNLAKCYPSIRRLFS